MYHSGWARLFCRIKDCEKSKQFKTTFISHSCAYPWALLAYWLNHQGTQANGGFILTKTEAEKREQWENNGLTLKASAQRWHKWLPLTGYWPKQATWPSLRAAGWGWTVLPQRKTWRVGRGGRETQERGDICKHTADSLCCTVEMNITLWSN